VRPVTCVPVACGPQPFTWELSAMNYELPQKKSALNSRSERLGSPPPELPNHEWIVRPPPAGVNVTLVISPLVCGNHERLTSVTNAQPRAHHRIRATLLRAEEKIPQTDIPYVPRLPWG
jgi:hypothetical protein